MRICKVKNCDNKHSSKGYCRRHYNQIYKYGKIIPLTRSDKNKIINYKDYAEICLYNVKHQEVARTKIDKDDLEKVKNYKWCLDNVGYAGNGKIRLHQLILGKKDDFMTDHINRNKLDNRKQNLRFATHSYNQRNTKSLGINFDKKSKFWRASININHKNIYLGCSKKKKIALEIRKNAEKIYWKEYLKWQDISAKRKESI